MSGLSVLCIAVALIIIRSGVYDVEVELRRIYRELQKERECMESVRNELRWCRQAILALKGDVDGEAY